MSRHPSSVVATGLLTLALIALGLVVWLAKWLFAAIMGA